MAAKTPDRVDVITLGNGRILYKGIFATENLDNTDTWDTGLDSAVDAAFKPTEAADFLVVTLSGSVVTVASVGDNHNGEIWVEASAY